MNGALIFLNLAGAVALLLWATRMVRTGVERAYGDILKRKLRNVISNPFFAVGFGLFMAVILQSSTAVTLLVGSFVGSGFVSGLAGLLAVRGGELGSALVVKILSYNLTALVPLCILIGTFIFMTTERRDWRQLGRIIVGVGLLILSLEMTGTATEPLRESAVLPAVISYLSSDPFSAFLIAALLTYFFHSSVAAIILLISFASHGLIHAELCLVMVLGVNLGSSIIAPLLTRNAPPESRIVPMGNLLMRGLGSLIVLSLVLIFKPPVSFLGSDAVTQIANAHILFNIIILLLGIPLSNTILKLTRKLVYLKKTFKTDVSDAIDLIKLTSLDETVLDRPQLALANATREVVRISDIVDILLVKIISLYEHPDKLVVTELNQLHTVLDKKHRAIKLYLAKLSGQKLTDEEALRTQELLSACIKLEQAGDIITRNMLSTAKRKQQKKLVFTNDGWLELTRFHSTVLANARMAFNVLISRDTRTAHLLVEEKDNLRNLEKESNEKHFQRLRENDEKSVESSSLHLDTIRDLKQINSLLTSIAYPILEEQGLLKSSRLRKVPST